MDSSNETAADGPRPDPADCPHFSWTGDEGPRGLLSRPVRRWKCDSCGIVRTEADGEGRVGA